MNDIPECSSLFSFLLYADDTSLVSHININDGESSYSPISIINTELAKVNDWLAVNKLSLNVKKTKFSTNVKKTSLDFSPRLTISGTNIERVKDINFLLVLNENLSWNSHIEFISTKVAKCIGIMNRLKRFLPPHILKTLYFTLVHSYEGFAAYVKKYIISSYSSECSIENCYVCGAWLLYMQSENCYVFMSSNAFPF